jgi:hypothetical protein
VGLNAHVEAQAEDLGFDPSRDHPCDLHEGSLRTLWLVGFVRFLSGDRWIDGWIDGLLTVSVPHAAGRSAASCQGANQAGSSGIGRDMRFVLAGSMKNFCSRREMAECVEYLS